VVLLNTSVKRPTAPNSGKKDGVKRCHPSDLVSQKRKTGTNRTVTGRGANRLGPLGRPNRLGANKYATVGQVKNRFRKKDAGNTVSFRPIARGRGGSGEKESLNNTKGSQRRGEVLPCKLRIGLGSLGETETKIKTSQNEYYTKKK